VEQTQVLPVTLETWVCYVAERGWLSGRLTSEYLYQIWACLGVFNDSHCIEFQDVSSLGGSEMECSGVVRFVEAESTAAVHVVPAAEKFDTLNGCSFTGEESLYAFSDGSGNEAPSCHKFHFFSPPVLILIGNFLAISRGDGL
jgi:hypothetical protein